MIYNHYADNKHPWSLALESHKENYSEYGTLYRTINTFNFRKVGKKFNISIKDFLDLPREIVELIFDICAKDELVESKAFKNVKDDLDDAFE